MTHTNNAINNRIQSNDELVPVLKNYMLYLINLMIDTNKEQI